MVPELFTRILALSWSVTLSYLLSFGLFVVNTVFLGHLGTTELAGGALGLMTCNLTGEVFIWGLLSGMDTLATQAYGAGNLPRVGLILQRAIVICCIWIVACAAIWCNTERLLLLVGQHPDEARLAAMYCQIFLAAVPAFIGFESVRRFLQCQSITSPMLWIMVVSMPFHILWCWLLIFKLELGFVGAPMALCVTYWLQFLLLLAYVAFFRPHRTGTWAGWSRECFRDWGEHLRLGLPGVVMTVMEWGCFEAMALIAGRLGTTYLAAHSVLVSVVEVYFVFSLGVNVAANVRVGQLLGEGHAHDAKWTAYYALMLGFGCGFCFSILTYFCRTLIVRIFTTDEAVTTITVAAMGVVCFIPTVDETQMASQGVIRGVGKQTPGTIVHLIGTYAVGLPCALLFAFLTSMKLNGMWLGMVLGYATIGALNVAIIVRTDWAKESVKAGVIARRLSSVDSSATGVELVTMDSEATIAVPSMISPPESAPSSAVKPLKEAHSEIEPAVAIDFEGEEGRRMEDGTVPSVAL